MQSTDLSVSPNMSEDCLYLNVWAPAGKGPYPVFVWIHGGSFTGGRSSTPISDGTLFAQQDIVHVTLAYRLGVFGFMDLSPLLGPDYADSGNNALRDLIAALQWINQNIAAFGGDPNRVTVGGESAGAKATAALMAIPQVQQALPVRHLRERRRRARPHPRPGHPVLARLRHPLAQQPPILRYQLQRPAHRTRRRSHQDPDPPRRHHQLPLPLPLPGRRRPPAPASS